MFFHALCALMGSLGFCVFFNVRGYAILFASIGGGIGWLVYESIVTYGYQSTIAMFSASFFISIYAELLAKKLRIPATTIAISAIIPLVPGGGMFYSSYEWVLGNEMAFIEKVLETLANAGAIAIGLTIGTAVMRAIIRKSK